MGKEPERELNKAEILYLNLCRMRGDSSPTLPEDGVLSFNLLDLDSESDKERKSSNKLPESLFGGNDACETHEDYVDARSQWKL